MKDKEPTMDRQKQGSESSSKIVEVRETFTALMEISRLLNTGLDSETLAICVRLCEQGANPEALATIIRELRRESEVLRQTNETSQPGPSSCDVLLVNG